MSTPHPGPTLPAPVAPAAPIADPDDSSPSGSLERRESPTGEVAASPQRRPGPDVVRALAIFGVIFMNYQGNMLVRGGHRGGSALEAFTDIGLGPLTARFAATFVLIAGVGVTLLTRRADSPEARTALRWLLVRRGLLLYGVGLVVNFIWDGTILPYYGAMFVLASLMFTLPNLALAAIGLSAAVVGWLVNYWIFVDKKFWGHSLTWIARPGPRSPSGLLLDVFFNGTHPLFPWLAFFCTGIIVGRSYMAHTRWRPAALIAGAITLVGTKVIAHRFGSAFTPFENGFSIDDPSKILWSDSPQFEGIIFTASALSTALIAFALISYVADRYSGSPVTSLLRRAGQLSLTIYLAHILLFNLLVNWLGWVKPAGLGTDFVFSLAVWIFSLACAAAWQKRFGRGPAEFLYRRLTSLTISPVPHTPAT